MSSTCSPATGPNISHSSIMLLTCAASRYYLMCTSDIMASRSNGPFEKSSLVTRCKKQRRTRSISSIIDDRSLRPARPHASCTFVNFAPPHCMRPRVFFYICVWDIPVAFAINIDSVAGRSSINTKITHLRQRYLTTMTRYRGYSVTETEKIVLQPSIDTVVHFFRPSTVKASTCSAAHSAKEYGNLSTQDDSHRSTVYKRQKARAWFLKSDAKSSNNIMNCSLSTKRDKPLGSQTSTRRAPWPRILASVAQLAQRPSCAHTQKRARSGTIKWKPTIRKRALQRFVSATMWEKYANTRGGRKRFLRLHS